METKRDVEKKSKRKEIKKGYLINSSIYVYNYLFGPRI